MYNVHDCKTSCTASILLECTVQEMKKTSWAAEMYSVQIAKQTVQKLYCQTVQCTAKQYKLYRSCTVRMSVHYTLVNRTYSSPYTMHQTTDIDLIPMIIPPLSASSGSITTEININVQMFKHILVRITICGIAVEWYSVFNSNNYFTKSKKNVNKKHCLRAEDIQTCDPVLV